MRACWRLTACDSRQISESMCRPSVVLWGLSTNCRPTCGPFNVTRIAMAHFYPRRRPYATKFGRSVRRLARGGGAGRLNRSGGPAGNPCPDGIDDRGTERLWFRNAGQLENHLAVAENLEIAGSEKHAVGIVLDANVVDVAQGDLM